jgi:hypothetical protein
MNFKEICESVLDEVSGRGDFIPSVDLGRDTEGDLFVTDPAHRNIIQWVRDANRRILDHSEYWSFLHRRGIFATLTSGEASFIAPSSVDRCSLFAVKQGSTVRIPIYLMPYKWWVQQERSMAAVSGQPLHIFQTINDGWMAWPTPNAAYTISGDWWELGEDLVDPTDEPIWDERFHPLLKWEAVRMFALENADAEGMPQLMPRVDAALPEMWRRFTKKYLPMICD